MRKILRKIRNIDENSETFKEELTTLWTKLYLFEKENRIINDATFFKKYGDVKEFDLMQEINELEDKNVFYIEQKPLLKVTNHPGSKTIYSKSEIKPLLDYVCFMARDMLKLKYEDLENESLIGECMNASVLIINILRKLNITGYELNAAELFDTTIGHSLVLANIPTYDGDIPYIIDITYRQFCLLSRCNPNRVYHFDYPEIFPGYFIDQNIAKDLLKNGYLELTSQNAKAYIESFRENKDNLKDEVYIKCIEYGKKLR